MKSVHVFPSVAGGQVFKVGLSGLKDGEYGQMSQITIYHDAPSYSGVNFRKLGIRLNSTIDLTTLASETLLDECLITPQVAFVDVAAADVTILPTKVIFPSDFRFEASNLYLETDATIAATLRVVFDFDKLELSELQATFLAFGKL